ncbi:Obp8a family protein [Megaselia abdita]
MKFLILSCILFIKVHGQSQSGEEVNYPDYGDPEGTTVYPEDYSDETVHSTEAPQEEDEVVISYSSKQKADMEEICMEKTKLDQELKDMVRYKIFVEHMKDYLMCVMRDSKAWLPSTGFSMPHLIALYRMKGLSDKLVKDILETCIDKNKSTEDLYDYVVSLQCCIVDCIFREQYYSMTMSNDH